MMCYELTDYEWTAIKAMLPNKLRGVPRMSGVNSKTCVGWPAKSAVHPIDQTFCSGANAAMCHYRT